VLEYISIKIFSGWISHTPAPSQEGRGTASKNKYSVRLCELCGLKKENTHKNQKSSIKNMFGIAKNIRSEVRECTPDLLNRAFDSVQVAQTCAEIEDALEAHRRGELTKEEYETKKAELKKQLPVATFHATFKNGKRKNEDAIPSGMSIYDLDHIANPRAKWAEIEARKEELGILLAHISPSLEGLRLVFLMQQGMSLAEAQAWMAQQLGDTQYDSCVKDYARCSFIVPRDYVLWLDEEKLFAERLPSREGEGGVLENTHVSNQVDQVDEVDVFHTPLSPLSRGEESGKKHPQAPTPSQEGCYPTTYEGIEYTDIVETLEEQMG
jgi:hypothetical protein